MAAAWLRFQQALAEILESVSFTDAKGHVLATEEGFARWISWSLNLRREKRFIFFIGNGASSSMASHYAADIGKNAGIRTRVFTDAALLTALGNDLGFADIYAEPLRLLASMGDMLLVISSSGNSPNLVSAITTARQLQLKIVTLSAMSADNVCRHSGDINIYVPAVSYGLAETSHAAILHFWADRLVAAVTAG